MGKRLPPITVEDHLELGNILKEASDAINLIRAKAPLGSKHGRAAAHASRALHRLRGAMEDLLVTQVWPIDDPRGLMLHVYYGFERFVPADPDPTGGHDAFRGWAKVSPTKDRP